MLKRIELLVHWILDGAKKRFVMFFALHIIIGRWKKSFTSTSTGPGTMEYLYFLKKYDNYCYGFLDNCNCNYLRIDNFLILEIVNTVIAMTATYIKYIDGAKFATEKYRTKQV